MDVDFLDLYSYRFIKEGRFVSVHKIYKDSEPISLGRYPPGKFELFGWDWMTLITSERDLLSFDDILVEIVDGIERVESAQDKHRILCKKEISTPIGFALLFYKDERFKDLFRNFPENVRNTILAELSKSQSGIVIADVCDLIDMYFDIIPGELRNSLLTCINENIQRCLIEIVEDTQRCLIEIIFHHFDQIPDPLRETILLEAVKDEPSLQAIISWLEESFLVLSERFRNLLLQKIASLKILDKYDGDDYLFHANFFESQPPSEVIADIYCGILKVIDKFFDNCPEDLRDSLLRPLTKIQFNEFDADRITSHLQRITSNHSDKITIL